ncbi:uncharacterized protein LOC142358061 [Convolutriloba macropyga]|uniref:uncharacterized protein LOC142358061 n=1 Tax=Convolutriloba macropyga TaxID=536237 RepID=UPI003F51E7BB
MEAKGEMTGGEGVGGQGRGRMGSSGQHKRNSMLSVPGANKRLSGAQADKSGQKGKDDSGDSEFWDEAAIARAITPSANLRQSVGVDQMYNQVINKSADGMMSPAETEKNKREMELNKRLSKFSEKRNSRVRANKGFFLRDKEDLNRNEDEADEVLKKDQTPSDKKRFNEKFRESLELYMNPNIHDSPKKGGGGGQNSNSDNSRKGSEGQQGTDQDGLFRCLKCKKMTGEEKRFTSFFERNLHNSIAHSNESFDVGCGTGGCDKSVGLWWYPPHVESKHNQTVMMDCPVNCCSGIEIHSFQQVWSHAVKCAGAVKYVCPICLHDCFFLNSHQLSKHLNDQHNIKKVNICVLCSVKKSPKIPASRLRASVHTAKCLICAKKCQTGLTPNYLLENAMAHLQQFHSHVGYLCINCMTIRDVNDVDHYERCLLSTNEGLKRGAFPDEFLRNTIMDCFATHNSELRDGEHKIEVKP